MFIVAIMNTNQQESTARVMVDIMDSIMEFLYYTTEIGDRRRNREKIWKQLKKQEKINPGKNLRINMQATFIAYFSPIKCIQD